MFFQIALTSSKVKKIFILPMQYVDPAWQVNWFPVHCGFGGGAKSLFACKYLHNYLYDHENRHIIRLTHGAIALVGLVRTVHVFVTYITYNLTKFCIFISFF